MAQSSKSQILNKLKTRSKGGWKEARKVEPKARAGGGLPAGLKNAVCVLKSYKLSETKKGDPFFSLTGIGKEPDDIEGRRVTFQWFMNDSEYQTLAEVEAELANDIGLMRPEEEIPEEYDEILEVFKELCERGIHVLFNTNTPRTAGKLPRPIVQGLADGWDDDPQEGSGEDTEDRNRGARQESNGEKDTQGTAATDETQSTQEGEPEPDPEPDIYIPKIGDPYFYTHKGEKSKYKVTAVSEEKGTVSLQQIKAAKGKQPLKFGAIKFEKLEAE